MQTPANDRPTSPNILIVDDVPENLHLLSGMLTDRGYKVRVAPSGRLALKAVQKMPPDLILLDINMPEMDGYETCERLKADPASEGIPVIFISALNKTMDKVKSFSVGGVDYVTKPFQFEEVDARVRTHLRLRQLQLELVTHNDRLEETVRFRTREITEARDQLADARDRLAILDKAKSDFLSLISHELRTPLNGLFGITDLIMEEGRSLPSMGCFREHFDLSREKILTIVDDALLLTQIEVDRKNPSAHASSSFNLALQNAIGHSEEFANSSNVRIGTPPVISELVYGEAEVLSKAWRRYWKPPSDSQNRAVTSNYPLAGSMQRRFVEDRSHGMCDSREVSFRIFDVLAIADAVVPGGDLGLRPAVAPKGSFLFGGSVTVRISTRLEFD